MLGRRALWELGLNYGHGTGHGVGNYFAVHECMFSLYFSLYPQYETDSLKTHFQAQIYPNETEFRFQ